MKKKGFTLVELLAVIVILAIIALIAIPLIGNVIEKAKIGALESSVNGLVESANMYYANNTIKGETVTETIFDFEDGEQVSDKKLEYKGKVYNGKLILHANGEVAVCIDDAEHYAYKNKDTDEIVSGVGTCLYDGTTGDFSSNSSINDLRGKTLVATDISQSADGLNTLIKVPEEGHYDENSIISVPIETIKNEVNSLNDSVPIKSYEDFTMSNQGPKEFTVDCNKNDTIILWATGYNNEKITVNSNTTQMLYSSNSINYGYGGIHVVILKALVDNPMINISKATDSGAGISQLVVIEKEYSLITDTAEINTESDYFYINFGAKSEIRGVNKNNVSVALSKIFRAYVSTSDWDINTSYELGHVNKNGILSNYSKTYGFLLTME